MNRVFAIMPFGTQKAYNKTMQIDFDSIYNKAIKPACEELNLQIIRADEEIHGGIIHTLMFERLVCADIAIVDLSNHNANVCYELGFRHCARSCHTIIIYDESSKLPFDFSMERAIPYKLNKGTISTQNALELKNKLIKKIEEIIRSENRKDSPAFELIKNFPNTELNKTELELYKQRQSKYETYKLKLYQVNSTEEIDSYIKEIELSELDFDIMAFHVIRAYEKFKSWENIITFINNLKDSIKNSIYFKERLALAYNKNNEFEASLTILNSLVDNGFESSEIFGLIGSIYKRKMENENNNNKKLSYLNISIENYRKGFNCDINNFYPGINLATLLFKKLHEFSGNDEDKARQEFNEVSTIVEYDLLNQNVINSDDYWGLATLYEIRILTQKFDLAEMVLSKIRELCCKNLVVEWQLESTLKNLEYIKIIYEQEKFQTDWFEKYKSLL